MGREIRAGFLSTDAYVSQHRREPGQERINMDHMQNREGRASCWNNAFPNESDSQSQSASGRAVDHNASIQSRSLKPSQLNLLASFGLSSNDLEELSHYPDNQLTPENMALLLEAIQKRKLALKVPTLPLKIREKEPVSSADGHGSTVKKKVIDYGHKSKYEYDEGHMEVNASSNVTDESMEGFQNQQPPSVPAAPSSLIGKPMNPTKELIRQSRSQTSAPNIQAFSPVNLAPKVPLGEFGLPAAVPPVMPPVVPPMPQPVMLPVAPPNLMPVMTQRPPPFAPAVVEVLSGHGRYKHTSRAYPPNRSCQTMDGQKSFWKEGKKPIKSPFGVVKASWLPFFSQTNKQKAKRLPTPSQMNDYYAVTPRIFPHICSLCNEDCTNKSDWIQHQNTLLHNENCRWLLQQHPDWTPETPSSPQRHEGDRQERRDSRRHSVSPNPKCSRHSSSGHARHRTRSRSRSSGRHRTSRSRSRSPRCLPSSRHRSRSPWQSLYSRRPSQSSSSKERGSGSSTRSIEGRHAKTPSSKKSYDERKRTHSSADCWKKGREDLEQRKEAAPHQKMSADETGSQMRKQDKLVPEKRSREEPECSALASLTERSILQAMAQLQAQGAAGGTLNQGRDPAPLAAGVTSTSTVSSDLVSVIQQVATQVITAVLDSKEASATQASTSVRDLNPQQGNSVTRKAKIQSVVRPILQPTTSGSSEANAKSVVGPSSQQGTTKSTKAKPKSLGSACPKKGASLSSNAKNKQEEGQCPKKSSSSSGKTKNKPKASLCPKKSTSLCSKAKNERVESPCVQQGSAASAEEENQAVVDQCPEQGIASSKKAANDSMVGLSLHQGTAAGGKAENQGVAGARPPQGTAKSRRSENEGVASCSLSEGGTAGNSEAESQHVADPVPHQGTAAPGETEDKCLGVSSSQQGIGANSQAGSRDSELEPVPGSTSPCSGTAGQVPKPRVRIYGDSLVVSAQKRASSTRVGSQLGLEELIVLEWHGQEHMTWKELVPTIQDLAARGQTPDVIIIHLGGDDLVHVMELELLSLVKRVLFLLRGLLPQVKVIWSEIIPQGVWHGVDRVDQRKKLNTAVGASVASYGGAVIRHPRISSEDPELYNEKADLSDAGLDLFLEDIKNGILAEVFQSSKAASGGLNGGMRLPPPASSAVPTDLGPMSQEAATQEDEVVSSFKESSSMWTNTGEAAVSSQPVRSNAGDSSVVHRRTRRGRRGIRKTKKQTAGQKQVAGRVPSCSGSAGPLSKSRVWICGHSVVASAQQRAAATGIGSQLGLEKSIVLEWHGQEDLTWDQLLPFLQKLTTQSHPPDVLIVHLGEDDLAHALEYGLLTRVKKQLYLLTKTFPTVQVLWSEMLPWGTWHGGERDWKRAQGNLTLGQCIKLYGGGVIKHSRILSEDPELSPNKGNLSNARLDMFLEDIKNGILAHLRQPSRAASGRLNKSKTLPPPSSPMASAGLAPVSKKVVTREDEVVSSSKETSSLSANAGEAAVSPQPMKIKAETSGVASPSPQPGMSGTCKAKNREVEQKLELGSVPPCQVTCEQAAKPRVWICGDALVVSAQKWDTQKRQFGQLDWLQQNIILEWHGQEDLTWSQLVPTLQKRAVQGQAPDVLVVHLGEKDFLSTPWPELHRIIKKQVVLLKEVFPQVRLMWSEMLPQNISPAEGNALEDEKALQEANLVLGEFISSCGGVVIKHVRTSNTFPMLTVGGSSLSHIGLDIFLEDIKNGIRSHVLQSSGAASGGLKEGRNFSPFAPLAASAGLEVAIQANQVVSSSKEASQIQRNTGEATMSSQPTSCVSHRGKVQTMGQKPIWGSFHFRLGSAESVQSTEAGDSIIKEAEETRVVVISNLPEAGLSLDEISNLTKPFGGLKDVLILSSHKKAYLEISQKSADSLVKFYSCFPMWAETSKLCISMAPEFKDIKDEEAIFISMIKDANPKATVESLHTQFVHLGNLPEGGYSELEILCVGLRFGRVDHYVVMSNKKKAILQLDSAESAASMCRFLKRYPYSLGESQLTFSRSPKIEPLQAEVPRKKVRKQEPSKKSPDLKKNPEGSGLVHTASVPSAKPTEAKEEPSSKQKVAPAEVKTECSVKMECEAASEPSKTATSEGQLAASTPKLVDLSSSEVKCEEALASSLGKEEKVTDKANAELLGNASTSAVGGEDEELAGPEEERFPFNLDEFVTVDEVTDEVESPSQPKRNPPRAKRKEAAHEPSSKRRKGKTSVARGGAERELSFVTLDEIGEDESGVAPAAEPLEAMPDPQALVTVDELNDEEELVSEVPRDPQSLVTLDEISEQEDPAAHETLKEADGEADLKAEEPLVTVDEIGEVEELLVKEPSPFPTKTLNDRPEEKQVLEDPGDLLSSQVSEDPSTLVTVDEIHEDSDDQPLVTLDEVTEEDDDFLEGELNFVTVDEVGSEDEEEERVMVMSPNMEELVATTVPENEAAAAIAEPAEGLLSAAQQEETGILHDATTAEETSCGEDLPEENKASETQLEAAEEESVAAEIGTQEATLVETGKSEGGKDLEESLKEGAEVEAQQEPPLAGSASTLTDQTDHQGSDLEKDHRQPSELERQEEGMEAEAMDVAVDGCSESVAHEEPVRDVAVPAPAPEASVGDQETTGGEAAEAGSEPLGQDPGRKEESSSEATPSRSSEKPEEELAGSECEGQESEQRTGPTKTLNDRPEEKQVLEDPGDLLSSQVPEDPNTLVTVDEIQEDSDDQPLVTLDEVTEEDDDFLEGELNFVTVDEVGSEDEEEERVMVMSPNMEELVATTVPENEAAAAIAEPAEGLLSAAQQEETGILHDATTAEETSCREDLPEENKASETQLEAAEEESVAAEIGTQEATLVETGKSEGGKDLEESLKEGAEVEAQQEPPLAGSASTLTDQTDHQGSDLEKDHRQPSELERQEEGMEAEAMDVAVDGCSESVAHEEPVRDVAVPAPAPEASVGDQETTGGEAAEAGSEPLGQDPGRKEESSSEATPSRSSEKPEEELAGSECEGQETEQRTVDSSEKSKAPDDMEDLDFLVPKAGFFCQICSCFCVDEASMKSHCQSALHRQNKEKFMNKKAEEEKKEGDGDTERVSLR